MRHAILTLTAIIAVLTIHAERDIRFYMNTGEVKSIAVSRIDSIAFDTENDLLMMVLQETDALGISQSYISRLEKKIINRLREAIGDKI